MPRVRKGDMVVVVSGAYKGKRGKILRIVGDRVIVEKVAMIKRHQKPTQKAPQGGIIDKEGTIHISNVALFDDKLGRGTRTLGEGPQSLVGLRASQIALGADHVCVLTPESAIMCWGSNRNGQLGNGSTERELQPVQVQF